MCIAMGNGAVAVALANESEPAARQWWVDRINAAATWGGQHDGV